MNISELEYIKSDGGRSKYFSLPAKGDCAARAISIISKIPYNKVLKGLSEIQGKNANNGVQLCSVINYMENIGFKYIRLDKTLAKSYLPDDEIVLILKAHAVAINGNQYFDTYKSIRNGRQKVRGYFRKEISILFDEKYF